MPEHGGNALLGHLAQHVHCHIARVGADLLQRNPALKHSSAATPRAAETLVEVIADVFQVFGWRVLAVIVRPQRGQQAHNAPIPQGGYGVAGGFLVNADFLQQRRDRADAAPWVAGANAVAEVDYVGLCQRHTAGAVAGLVDVRCFDARAPLAGLQPHLRLGHPVERHGYTPGVALGAPVAVAEQRHIPGGCQVQPRAAVERVGHFQDVVDGVVDGLPFATAQPLGNEADVAHFAALEFHRGGDEAGLGGVGVPVAAHLIGHSVAAGAVHAAAAGVGAAETVVAPEGFDASVDGGIDGGGCAYCGCSSLTHLP